MSKSLESALIKKPYLAVTFTEYELEEFARCADPVSGPKYFLSRYFYIQHPVRGKLQYQPFDYQDELIDIYHENRYSINLLGRQMGKTTTAAGYLLFEDPKKPKPPMMLDEPMQTHQEVPLFDFSPELGKVKPEVSFKPVKRYEVPQEKLPKELEGKVKKQYIIEYEAEARTIEIDNRTIQISPFKAWEHAYEN